MTDLYYSSNELFTKFIANSDAGEKVWNEVAAQDVDGVFAVANSQAKKTIARLRSAGYSVAKLPKAKPLSLEELDAMLADLY